MIPETWWMNDSGDYIYRGSLVEPLVQPSRWTEVRIVPADAIVIERSELPAVEPERPGYSGYVGLDGPGSAEAKPIALQNVEFHRAIARRSLALAEYLTANPPVDEAQVAKIGASLAAEDKSLGRHVGTTLAQYDEIARSLYRAGVRVVTS